MKTITESITLMVCLIAGGTFSAISLLMSLYTHDWWLVAVNTICIVADVVFARMSYKQAKRIEDSMRRDIQTVMNLQLFGLMRKAFESHSDFAPNGFGDNPKDKEDEVEEHIGTPV